MNSRKPNNPKKSDQETFRNKGQAPVRDTTVAAGGNDGTTTLREHSNPIVKFFARAGYMVWIIVLVVGLLIAFTFSLFLV